MATIKPASTFTQAQTPIAQKDGLVSWTWLKKFQEWELKLQNGLDQIGQFIGDIKNTAKVTGHPGSVGSTLQNIDGGGLVTGNGIDFAQPYLNKDTDHIADGTGLPLDGGKVAEAALVTAPATTGDGLVYNGTKWLPHVIAQTLANAAHKWLNSYDETTGVFTQTQPDYSDLSGLPTLPATIAPIAGEFLTGYDATTGAFSQAAPTGLTVVIVTAALTGTGTQGSMTFTNGILTSSTPAT